MFLIRAPKLTNEVINEFTRYCSSFHVWDRYSFHPLCEVVPNYEDIFVSFFCFWKWFHNVHHHSLKWSQVVWFATMHVWTDSRFSSMCSCSNTLSIKVLGRMHCKCLLAPPDEKVRHSMLSFTTSCCHCNNSLCTI